MVKHEIGVSVSDLALQYDMSKSIVSTILKSKEVIKAADVAGVTVINKQKPKVEKSSLIFMNEKQQRTV